MIARSATNKKVVLVHLMDPLRPAKGGAIRYTQNLLRHLLRSGKFSVEFWGVQDPGKNPVDAETYQALKEGRLTVRYVSVGGKIAPFIVGLFLQVLRADLRGAVIHVQREIFALPFALMRRRMRGSHLVVTVHAKPLESLKYQSAVLYALVKPIYSLILRLVFSASSAIIFVSRSLLTETAQARHYRERAVVLPAGIDTGLFRPATNAEKVALRRAHGIGEEDLVLLFVGRLERVKRPELLVRAVKQLVNGGMSSVRVIIVGDGSLYSEVERLVRELGLSDHVNMVGSVSPEKVAEYYRLGDLLCLTSGTEASPNVIKEALLSGLPFVATAVSDEIVWLASLGVGRVVPKDVSPDGLAEAIREYASVVRSDERLKYRCRAVGELFSAERVFGLVEKLYSALLGDRGSADLNDGDVGVGEDHA